MSLINSFLKTSASLNSRIEFRKKTPIQTQQKTLVSLLKKAALTQFGQFYNFEKILKSKSQIECFQENIPFYDYDKMHNEWWHLALENVDNVSWRGKTKYFALSSGTTGAPNKSLPITKDMLKANNRIGFKTFMNLTQFNLPTEIYTKEKMILGGSTSLIKKDSYQIGDLSGITTNHLPSWILFSHRPGKEITKIRDWNKRIEMIAKDAPNWDVGFVMGMPSWIQLMMEKIINYHGVHNIHEIWPNLGCFIHGGISFDPYRKSFEQLLGKPLTYIETYLASEGFFAIQNRPDAKGMQLILDQGIFFEFVPFNENNFDGEGQIKSIAKALNISEVEEDVDYALLISTCAGAWRYLLGDTIRFTDSSKCEIIITGRTKHFLNVCGEHLSVDNMNQAIKNVEKELNVSIREFTVTTIFNVNSFQHKWYLGCDKIIEKTILKNALDYHLKYLNADYEVERNAMLGMDIVSLSISTFYKWQASQGKMGGQSKFPRVMKKEQYEKWESFVKTTLSSTNKME